MVLILAAVLLTVPAWAADQVLVVTAHAGDYLSGAGGTLARWIGEGAEVTVVQVTNDEKYSHGLGPAETQKANADGAHEAARRLGAREVLFLGHKSGELGYISSTELREEMFGLIRYFKPRIIVLPDPYIHYDPDRDHYYAGKMAEEAWGYSGGGTFGPELAREGLAPYGAPEVYYYAVARAYRPGEGGEGGAVFRSVDITATFSRKLEALDALRASPETPSREYLTALAEAIGKKHGFRYGEEFNHVGPRHGLPEEVLQRAVRK
ncbi:MAG TPA: PIG-L family deacetylase [Bryobacteraceae bacterium]|nr:PIG-L family deacetylase [Bryobacteraceae bacterium]